MIDERLDGNAESALASEIARITGTDLHSKTAAAKGTPEEHKTFTKVAEEVKTAADMTQREVCEDENFRRGVADEIESQRHLWEPAVVEHLQKCAEAAQKKEQD